MLVNTQDVPACRFFVSADKPGDNIFFMCVPPVVEPGLCQDINDESYWTIEPNRKVRLLREDEHHKTHVSI
jgi:hypothetical protein